jgi:hypothetical protein
MSIEEIAGDFLSFTLTWSKSASNIARGAFSVFLLPGVQPIWSIPPLQRSFDIHKNYVYCIHIFQLKG